MYVILWRYPKKKKEELEAWKEQRRAARHNQRPVERVQNIRRCVWTVEALKEDEKKRNTFSNLVSRTRTRLSLLSVAFSSVSLTVLDRKKHVDDEEDRSLFKLNNIKRWYTWIFRYFRTIRSNKYSSEILVFRFAVRIRSKNNNKPNKNRKWCERDSVKERREKKKRRKKNLLINCVMLGS